MALVDQSEREGMWIEESGKLLGEKEKGVGREKAQLSGVALVIWAVECVSRLHSQGETPFHRQRGLARSFLYVL